MKREAIGNHRLKTIQKLFEPHAESKLVNKQDIEMKRPIKVDLSQNCIGDLQLDLNHILPKDLREINLSGNRLGQRVVKSLAAYLDDNYNVNTLNLDDNYLSDASVSIIVDTLKFCYELTTLRLSNNVLEDKTSKSLQQLLLTNKSIGFLGLGWGKLRACHANAIFETLVENPSNTLRFLDLSYNSLGKDNNG